MMLRLFLTLLMAFGLSFSTVGCGNTNQVEVSEQEEAEDTAEVDNMSEEETSAEEGMLNNEAE